MVNGRLVWIRVRTLSKMYALPVANTNCDGEKGELLTLELEKFLGVYVSSNINHNTKFHKLQLHFKYASTAQIKFVRKGFQALHPTVRYMAQNQEFAFTKM